MGKYPLTNEQFAAFIEATGKVVPSLGWSSQRPSDAQKKLPVRGVTWYLAVDYCDWFSEQTGRTYALPTEAEWEKAARGLDGRRYPWGDDWAEGRCNPDPAQITPVDRYEAQSVFGCYDLVGNLREWTCSLWGSRPRQPEPQFAYPQTREQSDQTWRPDSPRHNLAANRQVRRIYRGGPGPTIAQLRCSLRRANMPDTKLDLNRHGLRVVQRTG
jgi:formylglycine-generating enzyme required for sulfatase activity